MEGLDELKRIRELLEHTENISVILTSKTSAWTTVFSPPLFLDPKKRYELALIDLETYYSMPNIVSGVNNTFVYSRGGDDPKRFGQEQISLPTGSYEITDIDAAIQRVLESRGDAQSGIKVSVNTATLRSVIHITNRDYRVDMVHSTIRDLLGFNPKVLNLPYNEGDSVVNILQVNSIMVACSIVGGSYKNGLPSNILYSFFPNTSPGMKIVQVPTNVVYLPITVSGLVPQIEIKLLDQDGNDIDLRGETITIRLHIRSM